MKAKWAVVLCLVLLALPGCSNGPRPPGGINVKLEMAKAPRLNEPVEVTLTVEAEEDAPGTEVGLQLAPTVIVVDGEGRWKTDLKAKSPVTFSTTIKFTNEGYFDVRAFALCQREGQPTLGGESKTVYVHVTKEEGSFGIPTATPGLPRPAPAEQMDSSLVPAFSPTPTPPYPGFRGPEEGLPPKVSWLSRDSIQIPDNGEWIQTGVDIRKGSVPEDVVVSKVEVMLAVAHPNEKELEIRLVTSNSDTTYILWDREESEMPDVFYVKKEVEAFNGLPVSGSWRVQARDVVAGNEGYMDAAIVVHYEQGTPLLIPTGPSVEMEAIPQPRTEKGMTYQVKSTDDDVLIADDGEWVQVPLEFNKAPAEAVVSGLELKFGISHPDGRELEVQLVSSHSDITYSLWDRESGEGEIFRKIQDIEAFNGLPVNGTWSLRVRDVVAGNEGHVDHFAMIIYFEAEMPVGRGGPYQMTIPLTIPPDAATADPARDTDVKPILTPETESRHVSPLGVWTAMMQETFEGVFPGAGWSVSDLSNDGYERYWDDDDYRPHNGYWAAWPANGGADGLYPAPGNDNYPNNMGTWMTYGPFDLSDAIRADAQFWLWREIEQGYDWLFFGVSHDWNGPWYGDYWVDSHTSWEWKYVDFNALSAREGIQPFVGDESVWVGWYFYSDGSVTYDGPWIDDIIIRKETAGQVTAHGWFFILTEATTGFLPDTLRSICMMMIPAPMKMTIWATM